MIVSRFTLWVIFRILLILITSITFGFIFGKYDLFFNQIILVILLVVQTWELIRFVNRTNREITQFLNSVEYRDYTLYFPKKEIKGSFSQLENAMSHILEKFETLSANRKAESNFTTFVMDQLPLGIVIINEAEVEYLNSSAKEFFRSTGPVTRKVIQEDFPELIQPIFEVKQESSSILEGNGATSETKVLVQTADIKVQNEQKRVVVLKDLSSEVVNKELEAWLKLIRIMTHEIMNSATPISSLSETLESLLTSNEGKVINTENVTAELLSDLVYSIQTIRRRADGMLGFVDDYRRLTRVPLPQLQRERLDILVERSLELLSIEFQEKNIEIQSDLQPIEVDADEKLITQTLINVLRNAILALGGKDKPRIHIQMTQASRSTTVRISDNGNGIEAENFKNIFIPFFSTREEGSGIGLSLARQIMYQHSGTITATNNDWGGASFELKFANID